MVNVNIILSNYNKMMLWNEIFLDAQICVD